MTTKLLQEITLESDKVGVGFNRFASFISNYPGTDWFAVNLVRVVNTNLDAKNSV